jgi:hypothetical protein
MAASLLGLAAAQQACQQNGHEHGSSLALCRYQVGKQAFNGGLVARLGRSTAE